MKTKMHIIKSRVTIAAAACVAITALATTPALADRCAPNAQGNWTCTNSERTHSFVHFGSNKTRTVFWQVPEGTAPAGGWPVVFFYAGWDPRTILGLIAPPPLNPFKLAASANSNSGLVPQIFHELLDDPQGTGKKYAVIAATPQFRLLFGRYWDTNDPFNSNYSTQQDFAFFPDLFAEIKTGSYGLASQFNMSKRYAFGFSSGGYNTSRMAVTFNQSAGDLNTWKTLAILSASYATCAGSTCSVPGLPANHPSVKFWHGVNDTVNPVGTAELYRNHLQAIGKSTAFQYHFSGHDFDPSELGASGVKVWFDQHN